MNNKSLLVVMLGLSGCGLMFCCFQRGIVRGELKQLADKIEAKEKENGAKWESREQVALEDVTLLSSDVANELRRRGVKSVSVDFIEKYQNQTGSFAVFYTKGDLRGELCYQVIEKIDFLGETRDSVYSVGQVYGHPEWISDASMKIDAVAIYPQDECSEDAGGFCLYRGKLLYYLDYRMLRNE